MNEFLMPIQNSINTLDLLVKTNHSIPEIPSLLNRTVLLGGKRLRPALCFLMGQALGISSSRMEPFARAAEFTHSASLAHDDVVDSASTRRSLKTINAESSNKRAVLAGDLLLARVMVELSQQGDVDIIQDLALAVEDLVNGEWLQIDIRGRVDVQMDELIEVSIRKTASLMSWCCTVAARLSPFYSKNLLELTKDFGKNLGIAFQMMDDVIDFSMQGEKDYAKDLKEGIVNYVICDLLNRKPQHRIEAKKILGQAEIPSFPWTQVELLESIENIKNLSEIYLLRAQDNLNQIRQLAPSKSELSEKSYLSLESLLLYLSVRKN